MKRADLLIEAEELKTRIEDPNLRLFDATVLMQGEEGETAMDRYLSGHIKGACFFDHIAFSNPDSKLMFMVPGEARLARAIGDSGIANSNELVVYATQHIMWATRAWWLLRYAGHKNVRVLNGGYDAWLEIGGDTEVTENKYKATEFQSNLQLHMFADKDEVIAALSEVDACVVNTLPHDLYTGETDIFYGREGHITGSVSHPYDTLASQSFLSNEDLATRIQEKSPGERVITYCGGGIAATVNACASLLAGNDNVAVYDGSMSEWLSEGLPTTRGESPG